MNCHDFVVQGTGEVLAESIHFGSVVGSGAIGMNDPFLVPFREGAVVHFKVVHLLCGR